MTERDEILVVGAGPTGLALALQAHACGARVRVIEQRGEIWRPSRALLVHARTLEVLRPLMVTDALLGRADIEPRVLLHAGGRTVPISPDASAITDTPFAHLTLLRQADLEAVLAAELVERDVPVERGVSVTGIDTSDPDTVRVHTRSASGSSDADCLYLAGCDGAESTVRRCLGIEYRGRTYPNEVVLADLELDGSLEPGALHVAVVKTGLVFLFPKGEQATWRLLATRPTISPKTASVETAHGQLGPPPSTAELAGLLAAARFTTAIHRVAWSSRVRLERRLADAYRAGRVFLAGDAAHVHSPAGGQGMNTGIQDATNLGWKLSYVVRGGSREPLLSTYEGERRRVAHLVSAWTDAMFWAESGRDPLATLARATFPLAAPFVPALLRPRQLTAEVVRLLAQLRVTYRDSPLSIQHARRPLGVPRAGDRLPDRTVTVLDRPVQLHQLISNPGVHVLIHESGPALDVADARVFVHRLGRWSGPALMTMRPDGYVGLCSDVIDLNELTAWLSRAGLAEPRSV